MKLIAVVVIAIITPNLVAGAGHFCYSDAEGCGPNTAEWGPVCLNGKRQSPIDLPSTLKTGFMPINVYKYKGDSFRMRNNGHSVELDFNNEGPSTDDIYLPDPLKVPRHLDDPTPVYKFASAHFHWGANDSVGSEHCIRGKCGALELHLVHYSANYPSLAEAVASGDENALAVIGVIFDAGRYQSSSITSHMIYLGENELKPIVNNLKSVEHVDHDSSKWVTVNEKLDFNLLLFHGMSGNAVYSYKGSLTTPGCNEQVNWYVLAKRTPIPQKDLEAFRSIVKDGRGVSLVENNRPLQPLNGRKVLYSSLLPYTRPNTG